MIHATDLHFGIFWIGREIKEKRRCLPRILAKRSRLRNMISSQTGGFTRNSFLKETNMGEEKEKFFARNSRLSIEFSRYVLDHPELDEILSDETIVIFLPEFDLELKKFNLKIAKEIEGEGGKVLYVKLKEMAHKVSSRLVGVEVGAGDGTWVVAHG